MRNTNDIVIPVATLGEHDCPLCGEYTHPNDSNDDGVCGNCLGVDAFVPCYECGDSTPQRADNDAPLCASCSHAAARMLQFIPIVNI